MDILCRQSQLNFNEVQYENLIFLPVFSKNMPFHAFFDTGACRTILSDSTAAQLGVISSGTLAGKNNNGASIPLTTGILSSIQIGNTEIRNIPVCIIPDKQLDFGIDSQGNLFG